MEPTALKLGNKTPKSIEPATEFVPSSLKMTNITIEAPLPISRPIMNESCGIEPFAPSALSMKPKKVIDSGPNPLEIKNPHDLRFMYYVQEKKFDLSIEYIRSKIPGFTTFMYSQIRPILDNLERTNVNNQDIDVLDLGKFLQETIATKSLEINRINGHELIAEIQISHNMIVECVEMSAKKSFFGSITDTLFGKTIKHDDVQGIIKNEMSKNKAYRTQISELMQKYPRYEDQLIKLRSEMMMYIEVAKLLIAEFEAEGFMSNIDLINRRISSLFNSNAVLETAIGIAKMNIQKLSLYGDNIDNILNVLMPTLLTKMSLAQTNDEDYIILSEQIIQKLKG
jgi:hypothetical protein